MDEPWEDVAAAGRWLLGLEARFRPDIVHLNGYAHAALPFEAPVLVVGHSCVLSWWRAVKGVDAPPDWDRYRREVRAGLHAAGLVLAPTRAMLDSLAQEGPSLLESVGRGRGFLQSGGQVDTERAARVVLDEYRAGKIGAITFELP
jgi:hypothetical protein